MRFTQSLVVLLTLCFPIQQFGQDIELYQQFNGRYDYTATGNTLNEIENGSSSICTILTSSSATLTLNSNQNITAAYLYWAGSGTGDLEILVNTIPITAQRVFSDALDETRVFFAAFADITTLVQNQGSGLYTISEFDLTTVIAPYCDTGTNFGGWAITVIYEDDTLPLNQLNVYDGLQSVPTNLTVTLNNLNVLDNQDAKIGFIAWEGDSALAVNEQLTINGNVIGNPPLNPINNAFNGTNSFTGATNLYNMDIDVYNIQNNINIGDTIATIALTSGQDFVMINNIITVLNSQLPDATIVLNDYNLDCGSRNIDLDYTIFNSNSTDQLPVNTPIAFYADNILIGQGNTQNAIPINAFENGTITLTIPEEVNPNFNLTLAVDDDGFGIGVVTEINEDNNLFETQIELLIIEPPLMLQNTIKCDEGFNSATFNLSEIFSETIDTDENITYYTSYSDLEADENSIFSPESFSNTTNPQTIFIKVETAPCFVSYQFNISVENCPPYIPEGFSPTGDDKNDWFNIQGLYNIFENHKLLIYNRYGTLIFEGDNSKKWDGKANRGLNNKGKLLPVGTYFYVLHLNDRNYKSRSGWVYINY